ncbi:endoribonuclease Dicer homolog 2a-like isoform X3 [Miscanthus floridulus]|uniref:endoribonuclease Dicer homolog 2a-like isoform X3 n=1 Tax=Miscanthus floridulus TaxID=154761 RepID=UPI00345B3948
MSHAEAAEEVVMEEEDPPPPCDRQTQARWYQLEALERALAGNTLVFLETGAGKTLIAVLLLRRFAHRIRSAPPPSFAVFLVPTVVLVNQQAGVIEAHTDLRVAQFYGEKGVDFWDADTWREKIDGAEVLVMTPQILLDNLRHSKFRLRDIPLLIFDECHHATGNSPYACIFKEFYHPQLKSRPSDPIPRIFGMTASLINSKDLARVKYPVKISQLENLMNAKVYTVASESALLQYIPFATTRIVEYDDYIVKPELYSHTIRCLNKLKAKHLEILKGKLHGSSLKNAEKRIKKLNAMFLYCISELGLWLAAKAAEVLQSNKEICVSFWGEKLDEKVEGFIRNYIEDVNNDLSEIILKMTKRGHIGEDFDADLQDWLLTSKVYFLIKSLLEYRHMQDLRCIVFVKRVITSIVLEALLSTINQMSGWSVTHMAGRNFGLQHQNRNKHVEIVDSFRSGKVHLIIATQLLEEGLDVPSCNVIIRFDQATTVRSFIQSRGRARMQNSDYVLLIRRGDADALSKMEGFLASGQIMREESQRLESTCCQPPPNTLCDEEVYRVQSTGAIVTLNSSIRLIYSFCSKLPSDEYFIPLPRFNINKTLGTCTLHLPMSSPVQTVFAEGEVSIIKKVVCLNACRELHAVGALTDRLLPELSVPCEDEPDIVVDKYKKEQPDYFPEQLMDNWLSFCRRGLYYCYKISLEGCSEMTSPAEIVLAVKCDMGSDFISNSFKLWGMQDYLSFTIRYVGVIHLNQEQVIVARRFQTTILSLLISNDLLEVSNSIKSLLEMQVSPGAVYLLLPVVSGKIDWCSIKFSASEILEDSNMDIRHSHCCKGTGLVQTKGGPFCPGMLQNSVVCTPHNGFFYAVSGFLDLNANSLLHKSDGSVLSYKTHFKERHGIDLKCEDQPLLDASRLLKVRNFLHKCNYKKEKEGSSTNVFELPPELCIVVMTPVSANTLRFFTLVPSIMYRIQCMLLSMNLKMQLGPSMKQFDIPTLKILEALTAKKCNEEFSQESLETLGDSFLKYITTQHLFSKYRHQHEGTLTKMKKNLISNAALCELACSNNLVGYIRSEAFNPETWTIPGVGYDLCGRSLRKLKSKRIADSVEALIGAYLSAAGEQAAYLFLKSLGMDIGFHKMPVERKITIKPEELINLRSLELMLDYNFSDPSLLMEALTHGSYQIAGTTACYQRLEFLGDAVLDHIFTDYFYHQYPECTPELLTDLRSASVNNSCYAHAAVKAGLHKHILHSSSALHKRMADYLDKFGQSFSGPSHGWEAGICLPKVLGDVIESIAGAIYIDAKHDKKVVWRSMKRLLEPLATPDTLEIDPVKELHEFCDPTTCSIKYTVTCEDRVSSVVVEVQTKGITYKAARTGLTKLDAKKLAAKSVLQDMKAANRTQHFANGISCT